jgi:hypothetical protein
LTQRLFSVRPAELARRAANRATDQHALHAADHRAADRLRLLIEQRLQRARRSPLTSIGTSSGSDAAGVPGRAAVDEAERLVEADLAHSVSVASKSRSSRRGSRR